MTLRSTSPRPVADVRHLRAAPAAAAATSTAAAAAAAAAATATARRPEAGGLPLAVPASAWPSPKSWKSRTYEREFGRKLSDEECLDLLGGRSVGRIAVVRDGQPLIFPVNYILDGRTVAFRTDPGTKLTGATLGRVAFQIDSTDPLSWEGWSVLVRGIGTEITEARDPRSERIVSSWLVPWAGGAKEHWVAIASPVITGRRIVHRAEGPPDR